MKYRKILKFVGLLLAMTMFMFVVAGCSSKESKSTPAKDSNVTENTAAGEKTAETDGKITTTKDSLVIALNSDPGTMNPYKGSFGPQLVLTTQALESLFLYGPDGSLIPWLVKDYKFDEGNTGITLYLKDNVLFHNGDKMTAEDVVYSFTALQESKGASAMLSIVDFDNIKAVDEYTVHIPTKNVCGTLPHLLSNVFVVNKNTYETEAARGEGFTGTGPWKVSDWQAGVSVSFEAFEDYWGGAPVIKNLTMRIIPESSVRMIELENKTVDMYKGAASEDIDRVLNGESKGIKLWRADASQTIFFLGFNCSHEPFNNVKVRQAVGYALDREAITKAVFKGKGEASTSLLPGGMWYSPDLPEDLRYNYNIEKAKELLAEAGYKDGLRVTLYVDSIATRRSMAELIPNMLSKAGIIVDVVYMESAAFNEYMLNKNDYDMFLWNFGNLFEPSGALSTIRTDNNVIGGSGKWHYHDDPNAKQIDELLLKAQSTADDKERAKVYYDLAKVWAENAYSISITDQYDVNLVAENLHGMFYSPNINVQNAYFD